MSVFEPEEVLPHNIPVLTTKSDKGSDKRSQLSNVPSVNPSEDVVLGERRPS